MSRMDVALQQSLKSDGRKRTETKSAEVSENAKCPICLDVFINLSYLDPCMHNFCFRCIQKWSKTKAKCPLCKQAFNSIYHSIKSEFDFKKYDPQPMGNHCFIFFKGLRGLSAFIRRKLNAKK